MPIRENSFPNFDPNNITGKKLAEIGRWALTGQKIVEEQMTDDPNPFNRPEGDYTNVGWLDMRIEEICKRGKL